MGYEAAIAHLSEDGREHSLEEHLREVGELAASFASCWRASEHARFAGVLHDLGKYSRRFQAYIRGACPAAVRGEDRNAAHLEDQAVPGRVDHSTAGAIYAANRAKEVGKLIAFAIAGHHAGLPNRQKLFERLASPEKLLLFHDSVDRAGELPVGSAHLAAPFITAAALAGEQRRIARRLDLWVRMLFSALCDADFLDTEAFFDASQADHRQSARRVTVDELRARLTAFVDEKERTAPQTAVNDARRDVRRAAVDASALAPGVFTLTVPTGGGKTLAAMEFALNHALHHGLRRVVVAIPFTSIIEQSADVYRQAFGEDDVVLEHHSNFDPDRETPRSRLASQNWDAPIVVTTTVQLFESLFANRPSRCRKLHNLARSVIVLDEAQTLPPEMLEPTLDVLGELVRHYGVTVVISTATQPALGTESLPGVGLEGAREIAPTSLRLFERLRRVIVQWPMSLEPLPLGDLARRVAAEPDVLAITHRRTDARELAEAVDARLGDTSTVHLSALMCAEHRSAVLGTIRERKRRGEPVRVVSTQLVEAGVDLDFAVVYRALAGLDALAQAAGRCNREGRLPIGELRVYVAESSPPPGVLRSGLAITEGMLRAEPSLPLMEGRHYRTYFERLYSSADRDQQGIQRAREALRFEDVASSYRIVDDDWSAPVVVRYGRAGDLLDRLRRFGPSRALHRALGRYVVNVPRRMVNTWVAEGSAVLDEASGVISLSPIVRAYDPRFGLVPERVSAECPPDVLIVDD